MCLVKKVGIPTDCKSKDTQAAIWIWHTVYFVIFNSYTFGLLCICTWLKNQCIHMYVAALKRNLCTWLCKIEFQLYKHVFNIRTYYIRTYVCT